MNVKPWRPVAFFCLFAQKCSKSWLQSRPDDMKAYRQGLAYRILQGVSLAGPAAFIHKGTKTRARGRGPRQAPVNCLMSMEDYLAEHCMPGVRK
jgi:hypothetical protein